MKIHIGDLVVVNKMPGTVVYTVSELKEPNGAHLTYYSGDKKVSGGWVPVEICKRPTRLQMEYGKKEGFFK